jgi:hypothetical protein
MEVAAGGCGEADSASAPQAAEPSDFEAELDGVFFADVVVPDPEASEDVDDDDAEDEPLDSFDGVDAVTEVESLLASLPGRPLDPLRDLLRASLRESLR